MKCLKKLFLLQFLLLFILPITFADITITLPEKNMYNLGEEVVPSVSIKEDQDYYSGSFSLHIFCDNYDLPYYTIPLSLEADFRKQVTVLELPLSKPMIGKCRLKSNFEATDGENIGTEWSKDFFVTDELDMAIDGNFEAKPGEDVTLLGIARKRSGELLSEGKAKISFKGNEEIINVSKGKFEHIIHLSSDAETGNIPILIVVTDKYGNYEDLILKIKILPIPTRIENVFENGVLMPGDILKAKVVIYDHVNKAINGSKVHVKIFFPNEELMAEKDIQSMNSFEFETEKTQTPGNYILLSTFEDIKKQSTFEIESVRKVTMNQEGYFVHIENVGNVKYKDEVTIILERDDKDPIILNEKIDLEPGEKKMIDISKKVPEGIYDITLPEELVDEGVNQSAEAFGPVKIDDNRNVIKKTADGMSIVTGAVVGAAGYVASRPTLAAVVLVLIILGTVVRYSKSFIVNKIKGKKEDSTDHIFEDFKYENEDNKPRN